MKKTLVSAIIVLSLYQTKAQDSLDCSHSRGCSKDLTPAGLMVGHLHQRGEWMISFRSMRMNMEGNLSGSEAVSDEQILSSYTMSPRHMLMKMRMLMLMYGISDRLTAMLMFHYNSCKMTMDMGSASSAGHGAHHHGHMMKTAGAGDTRLQLLYGVLRKKNQELVLGTGISAPTGRTDMRIRDPHRVGETLTLPFVMQCGSGTWDFHPGIYYRRNGSRADAGAQASLVLRNKWTNDNYCLGNMAEASVWAARSWHRRVSSSLRLEGNWCGAMRQSKAQESSGYAEPSYNPQNYGSKTLTAYFGTLLHMKTEFCETMNLGMEYGFPLLQHVNGIQMKRMGTLNFSLSAAF